MSETIFDNPYLAEMERMEKMRSGFEALARNYQDIERRAFDQIEAAKVRALQFILKEHGQELCAAHPGIGILSKTDIHYHYTQTFRPNIFTEGHTKFGRWRREWKQEILTLCSKHLPKRPNSLTYWYDEFEILHPESPCYVETFESLRSSSSFGNGSNLRSLVVQRDGHWVREFDGKDIGQTPVTRSYPVKLFTHFELPLPDPTQLNQPEQTYRISYSLIDDPETEINYTDQEPWDKLFD